MDIKSVGGRSVRVVFVVGYLVGVEVFNGGIVLEVGGLVDVLLVVVIIIIGVDFRDGVCV